MWTGDILGVDGKPHGKFACLDQSLLEGICIKPGDEENK